MRLLAGVSLIPALAIAYYFAIVLPRQNRERLDFERQKYEDQKKKEEASQEVQEFNRQHLKIMRDNCVAEATNTFNTEVESNGVRQRSGNFAVDTRVLTLLQKRKKDAIDSCYQRYTQ